MPWHRKNTRYYKAIASRPPFALGPNRVEPTQRFYTIYFFLPARREIPDDQLEPPVIPQNSKAKPAAHVDVPTRI
ncbi:MAG: hypothetical protein BWY17_04699 [Deltaproteobacteria bacterium ADurb.Bin207]|nr:MAG: hypothetical protein BWY17_04699 [Deltaproteobacteria bacterium ADurb.Bin207]